VATGPAQLNVVVLGVEDLAKTRAFYEALGWRSRPRDGMFARFQLGDADLVLFPADALAEVVRLPRVTGEGFKGSASAMILDSPEALDAVLGEVRAAGGTLLAEPADRPWGVRTAYFADPEGNAWELACLPARPA
jgi:hypothetical protein